MAALDAPVTENPALARQAEILARPPTQAWHMANAIRALAIDAVEAAKSGHPGMPMGMADVATALWTRFHKFDAADPRWPDRDRFVLSAGHGSMLLYALLYLTGHDGMGIEQIKQFRQLHSPAAGHPEFGMHPAIETTTGPLGQGISTAVGMALAERLLAARFGRSLVDHRTWVIASDGDLMEGISHEAAALAGHLGLSKLTVLYDQNHISIDGDTALAYSDDVSKRFAAYGWATKSIDGHDPQQINAALSFATRSRKPTLIACQTIIGLGAPNKAGTAATHGSPLGGQEAAGAKAALGWNEPPFSVPDELLTRWHEAGSRGAGTRRAWLKRLAHSNMRAEFERVMAGRLPDNWHEAVAALKQEFLDTKPKIATRQSSQKALEALVPATPELIGGSADLTGSNLTLVKGMGSGQRREFLRPLHPLRRARARHDRRRQRHRAAWRPDPVYRHVLRVHRLHAPGDPHRRDHPRARHPRADPRFHRPRRGRPDPPADRTSGQPARHAASACLPPGRRNRGGGMLGTGDPPQRRPQPAGAHPPGAPHHAHRDHRELLLPRRLCAGRG